MFRCVFWAHCVSKMHLQWGLCPDPRCGSLQRSSRPLNWCGCTFPRIPSPLLAFGLDIWASWVPPRQIPSYAHGFCEQSKFLLRVPLQRKDWKTLQYAISRSAKNSNWVRLEVIKQVRRLHVQLGKWVKHCVFLVIKWFSVSLLMFNMFVAMVILAPCKSCYYFLFIDSEWRYLHGCRITM